MRPIEDNAFVPNAEHKLFFSTRLDLTDVLDKFDGLAPAQIVGELAVEKILVQRLKVFAHRSSRCFAVGSFYEARPEFKPVIFGHRRFRVLRISSRSFLRARAD